MIRPSVNELFIYVRCHSKALEIIRSGRMKCSKASSFNDPFDCAIPLVIDHDPVEVVAGWVRLGIQDNRTWESIRQHIDGDLNDDASLNDSAKTRINGEAARYRSENEEMGVVCFSEDPASVLMWSHYGGKHQGVVLGFTREDGNELGDDDACSPITYSDELPTARFSEILYADGRLTKKLMSTKAREWAYEKEWRAFYPKADTDIDIPSLIKSIIVGCRTPTAEIDTFQAEAARLNIPLLKAEKVPGKFALALTPIFP